MPFYKWLSIIFTLAPEPLIDKEITFYGYDYSIADQENSKSIL